MRSLAPCCMALCCMLAALPATAQSAQTAHPQTKATPAKPVAAKPNPATLWRAVSPTAKPPQLPAVDLDPAQISAVQEMLLNRAEADGWGCEDDNPPNDWLKDLTYALLRLTPEHDAVLVTAGNACGRSGPNSPNAAMWIIAFHGATPFLVADPQEAFNGAIYSIQPTRSSGLPDIVVTWRVSDTQSDLTYMRYDGKIYVAIAGADLIAEPGAAPHIEPRKTPAE